MPPPRRSDHPESLPIADLRRVNSKGRRTDWHVDAMPLLAGALLLHDFGQERHREAELAKTPPIRPQVRIAPAEGPRADRPDSLQETSGRNCSLQSRIGRA